MNIPDRTKQYTVDEFKKEFPELFKKFRKDFKVKNVGYFEIGVGNDRYDDEDPFTAWAHFKDVPEGDRGTTAIYFHDTEEWGM